MDFSPNCTAPVTGRFEIAGVLTQVCTMADADPVEILRAANMPDDWLCRPDNMVDAEQFFRISHAIQRVLKSPDLGIHLAKALAHGPFSPPTFAFSTADTVHNGLVRMTRFKPLFGPLALDISRNKTFYTVSVQANPDHFKMSAALQLFELAYLLECIRSFTGKSISPKEVHTSQVFQNHIAEHYFSAPIKTSDTTALIFPAKVAELPLLSRSPALWEGIQPVLSKKMLSLSAGETLKDQIRAILLEELPGGTLSASAIADRVNMSKRSLQRRLSEEGTNLKKLIAEVQTELAKRYLNSELSVPEISYLMGYSETGAFIRAFRGWTNITPAEFRRNSSLNTA